MHVVPDSDNDEVTPMGIMMDHLHPTLSLPLRSYAFMSQGHGPPDSHFMTFIIGRINQLFYHKACLGRFGGWLLHKPVPMK